MRKVKLDGKQPFPNEYRMDLEQRDDMIPEIASRYLQLVGILRWAVDLGHIGIFTEVAVMSKYLELLPLEHLRCLYHMFEYLMKNEVSMVFFGPFQPKSDESTFVSGNTGRTYMGALRRSLLRGFQTHWVRFHIWRVFLMLIMLVTLLLGVCTQVS